MSRRMVTLEGFLLVLATELNARRRQATINANKLFSRYQSMSAIAADLRTERDEARRDLHHAKAREDADIEVIGRLGRERDAARRVLTTTLDLLEARGVLEPNSDWFKKARGIAEGEGEGEAG